MKMLLITRLTLWLVAGCAVAMFPATTFAQQRFKVESNSEGQVGRYTQQLTIDVADIPGHQVRVVEIHYTYNDKSRFAFGGVKVREGWARAATPIKSMALDRLGVTSSMCWKMVIA